VNSALPLESLADWLRTEIAGAPDAESAVLAGHYALYSAGAVATDLLDDDAPSPAGAGEMLAFTRFTWQAACSAIAAGRASRARALVLVDDIQYVRPALPERGARERLGAALSSSYLHRMQTLPAFHARALREHALGADDIVRNHDTRWVFAERELRASAVTRLRALVDDPRGAAPLSSSDDQSRIHFALPGHGDYCLVHSGNTNCAGGYLELLAEAYQRGVRKFIGLVPMRCLGPVSVGTALAFPLLGLDGLTVVNVGVPDVTAGVDAVVVRESTLA
jgi:hypothetical protein